MSTLRHAPPLGQVPVAAAAPRLADGAWRPAELLFWLLPVAAYLVFPEHLLLINQMMIVGLFALSLDLIVGYARIASLGHAAFFGVGAYTAGLLSVHGWGEPLSGLLAAGLVAGLFGLSVSFLVVRGGDLARLMVTLGIGMMLYELANRAAFITGGADGLSGMAMHKLLGLFEFDIYGRTAFYYALAVLVLVFVLMRRLVQSPFGLGLLGIREGEKRMPAIGADVRRKLVIAFTISAAAAGVAGGLLAQTTQFVALDSLGFHRSAELLMILILGGTGRLYGALLGAIVFLLAHHLLANLNPVYWQFWIGLLLIVIVLFARGGIMGGLDVLVRRIALLRDKGGR
ncbi:MAG: branched-chain amino acid transporter permease [Ramlibacter sp.]|jgi:branched-chain amino acid transport system permease protein|nr:branched-chain amino acid transporter permease [Ramlibacter sp.]